MGQKVRTFNKGEYELLERGDLNALTRMTIDCLRKHAGRTAKYGTDELERFTEQCTAYFEELQRINSEAEETQQLYPSVEGLCLFLGVSRVTFMNYKNRSAEWSEAVSIVRNAIIAARSELASHGKLPTILHLFDCCNNGEAYYNTNQFVITHEPPRTDATPRINTTEITGMLESIETPKLPE